MPTGPGGSPVFPDGISGSISHCEGWSVGVAVRFAKRLSIGIDLVSIDQMRKCDISSLICSERERDWVHSGNATSQRYSSQRVSILHSRKTTRGHDLLLFDLSNRVSNLDKF